MLLGGSITALWQFTCYCWWIIAGNSNALIGTALIEKHYPIAGRGLNAYMGAGAHVGEAEIGGTILGPDLLLGVEFKLPFMPLTVAVIDGSC